jgi:tripartite-type tricarboxylate transporter receptor subunit TctC
MIRRRLLTLLATLGGVLGSSPALAQTYPARPLRLVVPFPAGGATDILARTIAQRVAETLGQPIVIDNRPGAGGAIGADSVAKAAPDGYTLLIATGSTHSIGPLINPRLPYKVDRDFAPVVDVARTSGVLVVPASMGVSTLGEFISLLRAHPGKYNFGSSGNGTFSHLSGELFKAQAGVFMTHIPYRGTGLVFTDMMTGQIHMLIDNYVTAQPHIRDGKLRVLGVTSLRRLPFAPALPTLDEQGLKGFDVGNWFGIYGPHGLPADAVARINSAFNQALQEPDLLKRLAALGATPTGGTPRQLADMVTADTARWAKLIRDRQLSIE